MMQALVIDDSRTTRRVVREILNELGFEVTEASNGAEALDILNGCGPVTIAFVDWNMPRLDGIQFVSLVRARPEYAAMRLMMVTTEIEMPRVAEALAAGANEYLMKPFSKDMIVEKLQLLGLAGPQR